MPATHGALRRYAPQQFRRFSLDLKANRTTLSMSFRASFLTSSVRAGLMRGMSPSRSVSHSGPDAHRGKQHPGTFIRLAGTP